MLEIKTTFINGDTLNITCCAGERWWIQGPTGYGKTSFFNRLSGLCPPNKTDHFIWEKHNLQNLAIPQRPISYLLQHQTVFEALSLKQQIKLSHDPKAFENQLHYYLPNLNLTLKGSQLSGGEKRVMGLIRMMIEARKIILLDESFVGLDTNLRKKMLKSMLYHQSIHSSIILFTAHEQPYLNDFSTHFSSIHNN